MKTELQKAINRRLSGFTMDTEDVRRVMKQAKGKEKPMKKRLSVGLAVAIAAALLSTLALAAELTGNVFSDLYKRYYGIQMSEESHALVARDAPIHTLEFKTATFTIDQAVVDGYRVYVAASVTPKKDANILLADEVTEPDDPIVIDSEMEWTQTYQQAMDKTGAKMMAASMDFTLNGAQRGDGSAITSLDKDGRLRMVFEFDSRTDAKQVQVDLEAVMYEKSREGMGEMERQRHSFTVDVLPTQEKLYTIGELIPGSKIVVESIKLVKAPLTMYYETTYRFEDEESFKAWQQPFPPRITYFDLNGQPIGHGTVGGGTNLVDGRWVARASLDLKDFPEEMSLMVEGLAPHTYHGYLVVRDGQHQ